MNVVNDIDMAKKNKLKGVHLKENDENKIIREDMINYELS